MHHANWNNRSFSPFYLQLTLAIFFRNFSVNDFSKKKSYFFIILSFLRTGALADLCQLDNGGCQQVCYNLCNLQVKCDCWPGYNLAYDGKTCLGEWTPTTVSVAKPATVN